MRRLTLLAVLALVACESRVRLVSDDAGDEPVAASATGAGGHSAQSSSSGPGVDGDGGSSASSGTNTGGGPGSGDSASSAGAGGEGGVGNPSCGPIVYGDPSPCLGGGSVVCFDGDADDYIHPGRLRITGASWIAPPDFGGSGLDTLNVVIDEESSDVDTFWWLTFSARKMGQDLAVGEFEDAERYPFEPEGFPGLDVSGDGRGCNDLTGRFHVASLEVTDGAITELTATFEQHCEGGPAVLRGCIHVER